MCVSFHSCYCKYIESPFQTVRQGARSARAACVLTYTNNTSEEVVAVTNLLGCGVELETIRVTVLESTELTEFCTNWLDFFVGEIILVAVVVATLVIMVMLGFAAMVFFSVWMETLPVEVTGVLTGLTIAVE